MIVVFPGHTHLLFGVLVACFVGIVYSFLEKKHVVIVFSFYKLHSFSTKNNKIFYRLINHLSLAPFLWDIGEKYRSKYDTI